MRTKVYLSEVFYIMAQLSHVNEDVPEVLRAAGENAFYHHLFLVRGHILKSMGPPDTAIPAAWEYMLSPAGVGVRILHLLLLAEVYKDKYIFVRKPEMS
jgi:hypothetical protein